MYVESDEFRSQALIGLISHKRDQTIDQRLNDGFASQVAAWYVF